MSISIGVLGINIDAGYAATRSFELALLNAMSDASGVYPSHRKYDIVS
jgi:hypothetical protein